MERLSSSPAELRAHYEIAVIGSGYGGGIAAARLARAGRDVVVFERGREIHPGEYPDHATGFAEEVQADVCGVHVGSDTALFDLRFNDDMNVIKHRLRAGRNVAHQRQYLAEARGANLRRSGVAGRGAHGA